ncbi:hypothetical protein OUZ56_022139 [Daphnia magna]|uniref:Uncharacterized protein n=1 Tax=Daphnia magna TaxID=35525 RepID=A0ABR0AVR1_9CRUS|nr:hypothetical protein OUZ56_022139 [Daphnia magna]
MIFARARLLIAVIVEPRVFGTGGAVLNLVSARRSRRVETVTRTSQWDYPGPLIGSLPLLTL